MTKRNRKRPRPLDPIPTMDVDNPRYEPGNPESIQRVTVERALRDDPLGQMHARGQLDSAQYEAGRRVQADYELSGQGRIKGMDTTQEPVDGGGGISRGVTDGQLRARDRLMLWEALLDARGWQLVRLVLIDKRTVRETCQLMYGAVTPSNLKYAGRRFRECLDTLAERMGLAT